MTAIKFSLLWALAFILCSGTLSAQTCSSSDPSSPLGIVPVLEDFPGGPPVCTDGDRYTPGDGSGASTVIFPVDVFHNITVTITPTTCGPVLSWTAPTGIVVDKVYVKGGTTQNVYDYSGLNPSPHADGNLHAPVNSSGKYAGLSHVDFCHHYELNVSKTATTSYTRTYDWEIDKSCNGPAYLTLSAGQSYNYPFSWTVNHTHTDSDFLVSGTITMANNSPYPATVTSISDVLSGGEVADVVCSVRLPIVIDAGATVTCSYSVSLNAPYNGINKVTVETSTPEVEGGSGYANFMFGDPTTLVDDCITVSDDCTASQTLCATDYPSGKTFAYTCPIAYNTCGEYTYTNTASFETDDTGASGSDNCTVSVKIPCLGGCTLTIGYWKTHSIYGPAPYDDTWAQVGENTAFFLSGKTWYQAAWTAPSGNAYYILAHQYIAARLNVLNGAATTPEVVSAIAQAEALFNTYTPAQIGALSGNNNTRKKFIALATLLDNYNNGLIGPGHCSEINGGFAASGSDREEATIKDDAGSIMLLLTPNPATEQVLLTATGYQPEGRWIIVDMTSRIVLEAQKQQGVTPTNIAITNLDAGLYFVQLRSRDGWVIGQTKLVIAR